MEPIALVALGAAASAAAIAIWKNRRPFTKASTLRRQRIHRSNAFFAAGLAASREKKREAEAERAREVAQKRQAEAIERRKSGDFSSSGGHTDHGHERFHHDHAHSNDVGSTPWN